MPKWQCSVCWKKYTMQEFNELFCCFANFKEPEKYGKVSVCTCGAQFHKDRWHLESFVDGFRITTVHLSLGCHDNSDWFDSQYMYFETMINKEKEWFDFQKRYATMNDAIAGHWFTVDNLPKIMLDPSKWPSNIFSIFTNAVGRSKNQQDAKFRIDNR